MLLIIGIIVFTFSYSSLISSLYCVAWPICRPPPHTYALKTNCVHLIPPPLPQNVRPSVRGAMVLLVSVRGVPPVRPDWLRSVATRVGIP